MRKGLIGLVAVTVIIIVGLYAAFGLKSAAVEANGVQPAASEEAAKAEPAKEETKADAASAKTYPTYGMGDPNAPVKIKEFASLSCSHCADFHNNTLSEVKKELIDTGKVYFEFVNFPLNASAMDGTLIALCLPEERYHQFISFLFEQQSKWAFDANYRQILKQHAKLLGASEEKLDACLADDAKKAEIVAKIQEADKKYGIKSTPSFVINEKETFSGALPFAEFKKKVDPYLTQGKADQ